MENAHRKEIFVVDDDDVFAATIASFLRIKGYEVREFYNVNECIVALKEGLPNLIITDYDFSTCKDDHDTDGFRFFSWVNKAYDGNVPFIVFSGQQDGGLVLKMVREGIRHYIIKDNEMFAELEGSLEEIFQD